MTVAILKLGGVLLAAIQEELTDRGALDFQDRLMHQVGEIEARGVVIDITALDVVDSFLARVINETADMAQVLGAEVVLCGMRPAVALTLVEMGRELIGVKTALDLEQALAKVQALIAARASEHVQGTCA